MNSGGLFFEDIFSVRKEIISYLGDDWGRTQKLIRDSLDSDISLLNSTNESILAGGGKHLRPILVLLVARACAGVVNEDSIRIAAASELLHNATLLHDDVADDSSERRGHPTVLALLGSRASVLLGDYWLVKAVDCVVASSVLPQVIGMYSKTLADLAEGEMLQLQKAISGDTTEQEYLRIIYSKTASLFETVCVSSAVSSHAGKDVVEAVREYAVSLGMAFQIKDDILDYTGTSIGKPTGVDIREQKITLPLFGAFAASSQEEEAGVRNMIRDIDSHPEYCDTLVSFVVEKGGIDYAVSRLDEYVGKAVSALSGLDDSPAKEYLIKLAKYTADRRR